MAKFRTHIPVPEFGPTACCADDVREQLLEWRAAVAARGGTLVVNSMTRSAAQQQVLRDKYLAYLTTKDLWEKQGRKGSPPAEVAAANRPGRSNHQGGRAADVSTARPFPKEPVDKQVDLLWETGAPFGFTPIIAAPTETASERWHFDCWNSWTGVREQRGYDEACLCSALDVGQAGPWQSDTRLHQALLLRAGYDVGEIDGVCGKRTRTALSLALGADSETKYAYPGSCAEALRALPENRSWTKITVSG